MKKPLLFIAIIASIIVGCKLDESGFNKSSRPGTGTNTSTSTTNGSIVGMWFLKTLIAKGTSLGIPIDSTDTNYTTADYFLFKSDKTYEFSQSDEPDSTEMGSYNYNTTTKLLALSEDRGTFTVNKLTTDSLIMSITISIPAYNTETSEILKFTR